jgi:type I restriction enzyme S subunit
MSEFKTCSLSEVTTLITKGTTPTTLGYPFTDTGINFIKAESVTLDGQIDESVFAHIDEVTHAKLKRSQISEGDILFSIAGMKLGKSAVVKSQHVPANTNQAVAIIRADRSKALPEFLHYHFLNPDHYHLVNAITAQSAQPNINLAQVGKLQISLPSLQAQRRITGILSAYDELIENSQRRIKILESMTRTLYREWFVHYRFPGHNSVPLVPSPLGEIPQGWELKRIDEALRFDSGRTINKKGRESGKTLVYGANGIIGATNNPAMADKGIIMGKIGSCGALHRSHLPCWVTNNAFLVQPAAIQSWELAWQLLLQIDFQQYVGGAANPYMPINAFGQHEVLIPSTSVQGEFQEKAAPIRSLIEILAVKVENLRRTRDILIPRLLSGQIDMKAIPA